MQEEIFSSRFIHSVLKSFLMRKKIFLFHVIILICYTARAQSDSTQVQSDSLLLIQIQNQLQQQASAPAPVRSAASANPDIGAIGDFRINYSSNLNKNFNAEIHEAEISLQSVVDPYARADFFI